MAIEVRGATVFEDYATMLGPKSPGADSCWCISYRLRSAENNSLRKEARREKARELTTLDPPPGVLAYEGDEVVGWAAIHRRADTAFATNRRIPHVDDLDVWSLWCIRVRPGWRKRGIAHELVAGAVEFARSYGAPALEAYPVDNAGAKVDPTMAYVGTRALFELAGFRVVSETTSVINGFPRLLMRKEL